MDPVDAAKLSDRELLLILHERVGTMGRDLRDLRDGTTQKLAALESRVEMLQEHKADKNSTEGSLGKIAENNDARTAQINKLTNYVWFGWGALAVLQVLLAILLKFGFPHS